MSRQKAKKGITLRGIGFVLSTIILIGITVMAICGVAFAIYIDSYVMPQITLDLRSVTLNQSSIVYYENENGEYEELKKLYDTENRIEATFEEVPQDLKDAFVAIEDFRFYEHNGVDWIRTFGAAVNWVIPIRDGFGGGSTITQQLIKNKTGENDFSVTRKIKEILTAVEVDAQMEKDEILEMYMNTIYLGPRAYGVKTAAELYFGKDLSELSLAECAVIAGLTNNPSLYDPFRFPENVKNRQELILFEMLDNGYITQAEYDEAMVAPLEYKSTENEEQLATIDSYFVDAIVEDLIRDLQQKLGYSEELAKNMIFSGGLEVYATVDMEVQTIMEDFYENPANFPNIKSTNGQSPQSSMIIIDPYTGYVQGVVGGIGVKESARTLNRATMSERSPGSAIKPVSVYAPAIDQGHITPYSVLTDAPFDFSIRSSGWPKNSTGGGGYSGQMTIQRAVELSTNTLAVHALDLVTPQISFDYMTDRFGFTTLIDSKTYSDGVKTDIGYAQLALGGLTEGVTNRELTASYSAFVNDGIHSEAVMYTKVLDSEGNVLIDNTNNGVQAFDHVKTDDYMTYLLERVVINGTGRAAKVTNMDTAGKTGTTDEDYDRWFVGYTPYYVGGVWFGYDKPEVVRGVSSNPALAAWEDVMELVHEGLEPRTFDEPSDFVRASYCLDSGLAPTSLCSAAGRTATGYFHPDDVPTEACNLHVEVEIDTVTGMIANEYCPEENVETLILLDLTRYYKNKITLGDEANTITLNNEPIGTGVPPNSRKYTTICDVHDENTVNEVDPEDPEGDGYVDTTSPYIFDPVTGNIIPNPNYKPEGSDDGVTPPVDTGDGENGGDSEGDGETGDGDSNDPEGGDPEEDTVFPVDPPAA